MSLQSKVDAVNLAATVAKDLHAKLYNIFKPYLGKKILKADRSLLSKLESEIPEVPQGVSLFRPYSDNMLYWEVKVQYDGGRVSIGVFLASISYGNLTKFLDVKDYKNDWTLEEVEKKLQAVADAEAALDNAKKELDIFARKTF